MPRATIFGCSSPRFATAVSSVRPCATCGVGGRITPTVTSPGADLQNSNVGGAPYEGKAVEYANCLWSKGRLEGITLSGGLFRQCRFEDVKIAKEHVTDARFDECTFSGQLTEIRFDGRDTESAMPWNVRPDAMVQCDLTGCTLDDVQFLGIDTRGIALPAKGQRIEHIARLARDAYEWAGTADVTPNEKRFLQMYWNARYVTKLPDDAEGWLDLGMLEDAGRELVRRSVEAALR